MTRAGGRGQALTEAVILTALVSLGLFLLCAGTAESLDQALGLWIRAVAAPIP